MITHPMESILFLIGGYVLLEVSCSGVIREQVYTSPVNYKSSVTNNMTTSFPTKSRIQCAAACSGMGYCIAFSFNKQTHECHMTNVVEDNRGGNVYGLKKYEDCPSSDGYILLTEGFCLKHHANAVIHASALSTCESTGDHLLLIENETMHTRIKEFLISIGSGTIWIDGFDYDKDNVYTSWKGTDLPYMKWIVGDPDSVEKQCIDLPDHNGFDFADVPCSLLKQFICQRGV